MHSIRGYRTLVLLFVLLCGSASAFAARPLFSTADNPGDRRHHGSEHFLIEVLSGRPDMVAGGDALVRVTVRKENVRVTDVRVELNGTDITSAFVTDASARTLTGLVTGMQLGENKIEIQAKKKDKGKGDADISLTNYPIQGPIFSGPHQQPFLCETQSFSLPAGLGNLGVTTDLNCHIPTRVNYIYRTTTNTLAQWPANASAYPANMRSTATGKPYIIRLETGTVNRSIYQIAMLHDPLAQPTLPSWNVQSANWNKRLIYNFGAGCRGGWYRQGASVRSITDDFMLSNGYALASASLSVHSNNCNDLTSAETLMMVKERFIENYGPPAHTQSWGESSAAMQQHQIADNYPGLLDGIIPGASFPDQFAFVHAITDAWLLVNYFNAHQAAAGWTDEQKRQVTGFGQYGTATSLVDSAFRISPVVPYTTCDAVPPANRYDPVSNVLGTRCDIYDHNVNVYGRDPATGFARRPLDNEGIQYGLKLVNAGAITPEQFVHLNEKIGGFDNDGRPVPSRAKADLIATRAAYQTGRLTNGGGGLAEIPIIDYRAYRDFLPGGDGHLRIHTFSTRARLQDENQRFDNQVAVIEDNRFGNYSNTSPLLQRMILAMDRWITAIKADKGHGKQIDKVVRNKPADLLEGCNTPDASPTFIAEPFERNPARICEQLYPSNSLPRMVAGSDVAADIIKCQRKHLRKEDYAVAFTPSQWARLQATFSTGVCDWSKRGYEQHDPLGTWVVID